MPENESLERTRKRLGCGCAILIAVGVLILVPVAVFLAWSMRASRRVDAELAEIRAAGEPATPDELATFYQAAADERETAQLWLGATRPLAGEAFRSDAQKLPIVGESEAEIPPPGRPWPDLKAAEALLNQYEDALRQLHEAADRGGPARYTVNFDQGINTPLDYIQSLRTAARLLALEARVRAHQGRAHEAARSVRTIFSLGDSLKQEPLFISQLVRVALDSVGQEALREVMPGVEFPDEDLERLQAHLRTVDYKDGLERAVLGERVIGIEAIRDPAAAAGTPGGGGPRLSVLTGASLARYLKSMAGVVAAAKRPWPQARLAVEGIVQDLEADAGGSILQRSESFLPALALPSCSTLFDALARATAMNDAADAAIAVERYRREHGKPPDRLSDLVPKLLPRVPADPFSGQPLRYVVREDEYVIYSVGPDGVDDGGRHDESREQKPPDFVFPVKLRRPGQPSDLPSASSTEKKVVDP